MIPIIAPQDIRPHLDIMGLLPAAEEAFRAISDGTAQSPMFILHPNDLADIHVKSAAMPGCPVFTVKLAGWSQVLADRGESASSGMIAIFDSATCRALAILQDDHLISDFRTAAAGAAVARHLIRPDVRTALVVGTGTQARLQADAVLLMRDIETMWIWGRSPDRAQDMAQALSARYPQTRFRVSEGLERSVRQADVIVMATGAREPLVHADWLGPGQHITSVGSDDATKCEVDPKALAGARVFVDARTSAVTFGSTGRAVKAGLVPEGALTEMGEALRHPPEKDPAHLTIACLSGLGVQDLMVVDHLLNNSALGKTLGR